MRSKQHGIGSGNALILLIFMVVTLTVFSVLTLLTANSEAATAQKSADNQKAYYAADLDATIKMAQLSEAIKTAFSEDDIAEFAETNSISVKNDAAGATYSYTVPIDEKRQLYVELRYEESSLKVNAWKTIGEDYEYDDDINVWDGEGLPSGI